MSSNFGKDLNVSVFGASHGHAIGAVVDGLPCGASVNIEELTRFMKRRAPGQSLIATQRKEPDTPVFMAGLVNDRLSGSPLAFYIENTNQRSADYNNLRDVPRPSHADYTARVRYGDYVDLRGGGHFSARLTAPLCCAGGIAIQLLAAKGIRVGAHLRQIGHIKDAPMDYVNPPMDAIHEVGFETLAMVDNQSRLNAITYIDELRQNGNSTGGIVEVFATGMPVGIGNPNFDGVENRIARAIFGIPGVKGISFGSGFDGVTETGAQQNDPFRIDEAGIHTTSNNSGGIQGGITNGMPLVVQVALKPTASISLHQKSISFSEKSNVDLQIKGRHDPCIAVRAVPIVEAVTALVLLDLLLPHYETLPDKKER
ncbi:MAG: chorismate synthase [Veillonella sp.]|uniref:chorismate synthase n=1 Tax=Veillonella sp. TaxID=1926307 RepID=UPI0025F43782|nr:chorismate synthase [Veillonella sp.]MBS4913234.1 chorismate synthase [Veillonella sp.]